MPLTYVAGAAEDGKNFQRNVAGESGLRGAATTTYHSSQGIKKYRYVYNAHSASRTTGIPAFYDLTGTTYRGLEVKQAATGNLAHLAGIHVETCTSGVWCWIQTEGYYSNAQYRMYGTATNANLAARSYLVGLNATDELVYGSAADGAPNAIGYCINVASAASAGTSTVTTTGAIYVFGAIR